MSSLNDQEYYARREAQERSRATGSNNAAIAAIHTDMANRYAELKSGAKEPGRPRVRLRIAYSAS